MRSDRQNCKAGFPSSSLLFRGLTEEGKLWAGTEVEDTQTWNISEAMRAEQTHPGGKGCDTGDIPISLIRYDL